MATILAQLFVPQARYTSISLSYGVAAAFWAGLSPIAATFLYDWTGSIWSVLVKDINDVFGIFQGQVGSHASSSRLRSSASWSSGIGTFIAMY